MGEQLYSQRSSSYAEEAQVEELEIPQGVETEIDDQAVEVLLDEIDDLLSEVNAETFVQNFVQKGGQ
jgi:ubiquitin-like protein Pup